MPKKSEKRNVNVKVIIYSVVALYFVYLSFKIDWLFLIPVVILIWLNQKELMKFGD